MPQMPHYEAQRNITAREAAPRLQEAGRYAQIGEGVSKTISDLAQKMSDANDVMQYTQAKAIYEKEAAQIMSEASADTGITVDESGNTIFSDNSKIYKDRLEELKARVMDPITNQAVAGKAGMEFDMDNGLNMVKINADFKQKQLELNEVNVHDTLSGLVKKRINASTDGEKAKVQMEIDDLLALNIASGVLDPDKARVLLMDATKTGIMYEIYSDPSTTEESSEILDKLEDPKGEYAKRLDPDDRLSLINKSKQRIEDNKATIKKAVENTEVYSLDTMLTNQQSFDKEINNMDVGSAIAELDRGMDAGEYDAGWAKSRKKAILSRAGIDEAARNEFEANILMKINGIETAFSVTKVGGKKRDKVKDAKDYLKGINEIEIEINNALASGHTTEATAQSLRKKIYTNKTAEATKKVSGAFSWGYTESDAYNNIFKKQLSTADAYLAVRQYFNETDGEKIGKKEGAALAAKITDNIKMGNRNAIFENNDLLVEERILKFETEQEAIDANLAPGTPIMIGNRTAIWR